MWEYEGCRPVEEGVRETVCALGNGGFGVREAVPGEESGADRYRGTCAAGCYSHTSVRVADRAVRCEAMANLPGRFRARSLSAVPGKQHP
ncbi:hypothetical protein ABZ719_18805 [Streptomyces sp. NPDC006743]|uniref:hypothetical protein n=1 Tax=Streptomyces sp. NPDC006743 TaxID=3154480 RepID=UPI00345731F9